MVQGDTMNAGLSVRLQEQGRNVQSPILFIHDQKNKSKDGDWDQWESH